MCTIICIAYASLTFYVIIIGSTLLQDFFYDFVIKSVENIQNLKFSADPGADPPQKMWECHLDCQQFQLVDSISISRTLLNGEP